jgi:hypothetical protein
MKDRQCAKRVAHVQPGQDLLYNAQISTPSIPTCASNAFSPEFISNYNH